MPKYTYYISVPVTGAVNVLVESDEPLEEGDDEKAFNMAMDAFDKIEASFDVNVPEKFAADEDTVNLADGWQLHKHLNRGNVCHTHTPEIYGETETKEDP
jgi:hypothetical protein